MTAGGSDLGVADQNADTTQVSVSRNRTLVISEGLFSRPEPEGLNLAPGSGNKSRTCDSGSVLTFSYWKGKLLNSLNACLKRLVMARQISNAASPSARPEVRRGRRGEVRLPH